MLLSLLIRLVVLAALLWLAGIDVRERRLPTKIVLAIGALFFVDAALVRMPIHQVGWHLALAVAVFIICAVLFAARLLGGGDAKLAAIIFLWTGPMLALPALLVISVVGTLVSFVSLATRKMDQHQASPIKRAVALFSATRGVPYGVALAVGGGSIIVLSALLPLILTR